MVSVFVVLWDQFLTEGKKNKIVLALKKLSTDYFTTEATEDSVMEIDNKQPANCWQLEDLV